MSAEKVTPKSDEESVGGVVNLVTHTLMDQSGSESTRSEPVCHPLRMLERQCCSGLTMADLTRRAVCVAIAD